MSTSSPPPQRPNTADSAAAWPAYWEAQEQPWRTEPEIDDQRQRYLGYRFTLAEQQGKHPFTDMALSRADIEWLIVTQRDEAGSVVQSDRQRGRHAGLDLQGANLQEIVLRGLPLEGANLSEAHLEGAALFEAHLEGADLSEAHLEGANLSEAHLEGAVLWEAHLEGANLSVAHLEGANLRKAHLEGADLSVAHLEGAYLFGAHLEGAVLFEAHLEGANLRKAHLEGAVLFEAHLEGADLREAHLEGAVLSSAFFTSATNLSGIVLGNKQVGFASLAGVRWGEVDLSVVDWTPVNTLGDEQWARRRQTNDGELKDAETRLDDYRTAVRVNRQLLTVLRDQGMNEEADRFAYRAQVLQRVVWRRQRKFLKYVGSWLLSLLAGYGYRPLRSVLVYVLLILGFAAAFFAFGHLKWYEALVVSLTAFHGRGFFSQQYQPGDPQSIIAALEAVVGLLIEISFIATFTQRFFGK